MDISVVVCTYNRARGLAVTLDRLREMTVPALIQWELILVDNNSSDETRAVIEEFIKTSGFMAHYVFEKRQGLSHARNSGVRAAKGEVIAFTDDDVYPQQDWLTVIWREFAADPSLYIISGRVELFNPLDLPVTVRRCNERTVFGSLFDSFNLMAGCNLALRRSLFGRIGCFDTDLGTGTKFKSAEDSDLFFRAWRSGAKMVYEPSLVVFHDHGRRTPEAGWSIRRNYLLGRGAFFAKHTLHRDWLATRAMYGEICWLLQSRQMKVSSYSLVWLFRGFIQFVLMRLVKFLKGRRGDGVSVPAGESD